MAANPFRSNYAEPRRLGVDVGTTDIVVAAVDRGNYPLVSFDGVDPWPPLDAKPWPMTPDRLLAGDDTTLGAERPHLAEWRERGW